MDIPSTGPPSNYSRKERNQDAGEASSQQNVETLNNDGLLIVNCITSTGFIKSNFTMNVINMKKSS